MLAGTQKRMGSTQPIYGTRGRGVAGLGRAAADGNVGEGGRLLARGPTLPGARARHDGPHMGPLAWPLVNARRRAARMPIDFRALQALSDLAMGMGTSASCL